MMIAIYRLGAHIVLPGINPNKMSETGDSNTGILGLIDAFSGGAFNQASILALGIMPYISASGAPFPENAKGRGKRTEKN